MTTAASKSRRAYLLVENWSSAHPLKAQRLAKGHTAAELAELAGVSRSTVIRAEAGSGSDRVFRALARALDVPEEWIRGAA